MPDNLPDVFGPFLEKPRSAVLPVFGSIGNKLELLGSSVLIGIGHEIFLLTAAHVTDFSTSHDLMVPGKDSFVHITGSFADMRMPASGRRMEDRYDIAYYKLDLEFIERIHPDFTMIESEDADTLDQTEKGDAYSLIGFPVTKSEVEGREVSNELLTLSGEGTDAALYEKLKLRPEHHLIIRYRRKKGVSYLTGQRTISPSPHGMSGGGVFAWSKQLPDPAALAIPKLVAITTEYHPEHNIFVSTRLHCFLVCILKNNPSLSEYVQEIPRPN